jgi:serine/threonine-protein kinase
MKICPQCASVFQADELTCPHDGETLVASGPPGEARARGFATTALGPADVRDTPISPPTIARGDDDEGPDPFVGRTLSGLYRVQKRIGRGGMGTVYVAEHIHLQKQFAVKVLLPEVAKHATAVERLRQEAVAASRIEHENIVGVASFDRTEEGDVFIVMEMLRGEDLATLLGRGPLAIDRAIPIALQICGALGAAHAAGIVHRDLKPENVFLVKRGDIDFVKVLDFGISKVKSADAEQVRMTRTGQLVGTPLYMSPEQARGESDIDKRVDVYALGVMLYEMLTGAPPFEGDNYFQLLWKHGNEPPQPMRARNPNMYIPEALEAVVARALAKKRDERFQSMEELEAALVAATPELAALPAQRFSMRPQSITPSSLRPSGGASQLPATVGAHRPADPLRDTIDESRPAGRPRAVLIGAALAVLLVAGVGVALALRGGGGGTDAPPIVAPPIAPVAQPPAELPIVPQEAQPVAPPVVEADAGPVRVAVRLASTPPGAMVWDGDARLGVTPLEASLEVGRSVELRFTLAGYNDVRRALVPTEGAAVEVALRARRAVPAGGGGGVQIKQEF